MDLQLEDKLALVSGSTAGIGFAIANGLAREGAHVIVNGRSEDRVTTAIERIRSSNADAKLEGIAVDLASAAGVKEVVRRFPDIDVLVNNLGIFEPKPFEQISDEEWLRVFRGQRYERCTAEPRLSTVNEETELGPNRFHFE
jgi:NAD(P)-dependent dehydrogenase (short-subunit alcohol dehydrogenase family)